MQLVADARVAPLQRRIAAAAANRQAIVIESVRSIAAEERYAPLIGKRVPARLIVAGQLNVGRAEILVVDAEYVDVADLLVC